jgi:MFS family permease
VLASVVGLAAAGAVEWVGYRLCGEWFPDNALKRRGALAYLSVLALLLAPLVALLTYALFP